MDRRQREFIKSRKLRHAEFKGIRKIRSNRRLTVGATRLFKSRKLGYRGKYNMSGDPLSIVFLGGLGLVYLLVAYFSGGFSQIHFFWYLILLAVFYLGSSYILAGPRYSYSNT